MQRRTASLSISPLARRSLILPVLLLAGFCLGSPRSIQAQVINDSWNGNVSNNYSTAGNWSAGVPNNGTPSGSTYNVLITNATGNLGAVISGISPTISGLTTGSLNSLTVANGNVLTIVAATSPTGVGTSISNSGTLAVDSTGSSTELLLAGASGFVTLTGGGSLTLSNTTANIVTGATSTSGQTETLVNVNNTISGAGQLGNGRLNIMNQSIIDANVSNVLTVSPGTGNLVTNTGTLEATAGGTLALTGAFANAGGLIQSIGTGSTVFLSGATITGGTLTTDGVGSIQNNGTATLSGVAISNGSTVTLNNGSSTTLLGTITNNGTILQNSSGSTTNINIGAAGNLATTLAGTGSLTMSNIVANEILGAVAGAMLTNSSGFTIQGAGQIGGSNLTLVNSGTVDANVSNALSITSAGVTNTGTLEATVGGTLALSTTITNTNGLIESLGKNGSNGSSAVLLSGATINGGTLTTDGVGSIQNNGTATLSGVTITNGSTITLNNGSDTTLLGTISNNGTIFSGSSGSSTIVFVGATGNTATSLSGAGTLTMSNVTANEILGAVAGATLTNGSGQTIQGAGLIGGSNLALINNGTIDANVSNTLTIGTSAAVTNNGTIEATAGGSLTFATTVNNASGLIQSVGAGSAVNFNAATINGGTLTTSGGGVIDTIIGGTATLNGVTITNGSTITLNNGSNTTLLGTITNNGTMAENSSGSVTTISVGAGGATLSGTGTLTLSNATTNDILSTVSATTLTNSLGHTIQGAGSITSSDLSLINNGTINGNVSNSLTLNLSSVTNNATLEATSGGLLTLSTTVNNGTTGLIQAVGVGSTVNLNAATINGGTLTTSGGGVIDTIIGGTATLNGVTITNGSTITLNNGSNTTLLGTITNNGTIAENSSGSVTTVSVGATGNVTTTLNGTGTLMLSNLTSNIIDGVVFGATLVNGASHTIEGSGSISTLSLINNGTVLANQSNTLTISPGGVNSVTNNGVFQANAGSELYVNAPGTFTNFNNANGTLTSGTYNVFGAASQGIFQFNNNGFSNDVVTNAATILLDGATSRFWDQTSANALASLTTNAATGSLTIQDGRNFSSLTTTNFTNAGNLTIGETSNNVADSFAVGNLHNYVQSGGTTFLANGMANLSATAIMINGGLVEGIGTLTGSVSNAGGTLLPGDAPGTLSIAGSYTQTAGALSIGIAGPMAGSGLGVLEVAGTATLGGTLDISLLGGFTPTNGEQFIILTSSGLSGMFATINGLTEGNATFTIDYGHLNANDVTLVANVSTVPEPTSLLMMGLGLAGVGLVTIRKRLSRRLG